MDNGDKKVSQSKSNKQTNKSMKTGRSKDGNLGMPGSKRGYSVHNEHTRETSDDVLQESALKKWPTLRCKKIDQVAPKATLRIIRKHT